MLYRFRLERSLREIGVEPRETDRLQLRAVRHPAKAGRYILLALDDMARMQNANGSKIHHARLW
jgi:hypothetical protein